MASSGNFIISGHGEVEETIMSFEVGVEFLSEVLIFKLLAGKKVLWK